MPMPGGDAAVKWPGRMALGALHGLMGREAARVVPWMDGAESEAVLGLLERNVSSPLTCGMGRLFDAVAAILEVCTKATYEGQPAIELEGIAEVGVKDAYPVEMADLDGKLVADGAAVLAAAWADREAGVPVPVIAGRFQNTVVEMIAAWVAAARSAENVNDVCLSGGCFQNAILTERCSRRLADEGFTVYRHRAVPPNDGGVALGQMAVAANS
jgi:hydrogenase maturation protein HypF